jgi:hypothetical protein
MYPVENLGLPVENLWKTPVPSKLQSYLKATVQGSETLNQARLRACRVYWDELERVSHTIQRCWVVT